MMITAFGGSLLLAFMDQLIPLITNNPETARLWNIYLGFIAFCLLDTSNEMTMVSFHMGPPFIKLVDSK